MAALKLMTIGLLLFSYTFAEDSSVELKLREFGIVPDVIDTAPNGLLQVTYPSDLKVELGNELTPTQVRTSPALDWDADNGALYTVLLTDPDAPPRYKEFRHWLVVNIPGNNLSEGKTVVDYVGPGAPKGTGLHRYVFLLFKQPKLIETDTFVPNNTRNGRVKTKARDLIKEYSFGTPVAGNLFLAQYDDYVPNVHAQLGGAPILD